MVAVGSWGRLSHPDHEVHFLHDSRDVRLATSDARPGLPRGMGRSYGDVCLNPGGILWNTVGLDRFVDFDEDTGRLVCESGVLLQDIQRLAYPRGWALPVTPGTQLVTVGGAIANDVHGKNHHVAGTFGDHVRTMTLRRTDGEAIECGPDKSADWYAATVGGLGLTGLITQAELQLQRVAGPWLDTETIPYSNLDEFFALVDESDGAWQYTVSWIDCLDGAGRGIFMRANPAPADTRQPPIEKSKTMAIVPPFSLINRFSLRPFNTLYYHLQKSRGGLGRAHYTSFFYPLDNVLEWNRMYGPRGFYQYQSVVPLAVGRDAVTAMLREISRSGEGSFLAVLKTFGNRIAPGMLSFPQPGVTLALDFPNNGASTLRLFDRIDTIVREAGGRVYPAKDARMPRALFESGYPRLPEFLAFRDPGISSAMSKRLIGT